MVAVKSKINLCSDRVIFAGIDMKACICYDGDGNSLDRIIAMTGETSNLFIEEQAEGTRGSRLTLRAFDLNYYQAELLLSCLAVSIGEAPEATLFTTQEEREFALRPIYTFRARDLNIAQISYQPSLIRTHGPIGAVRST